MTCYRIKDWDSVFENRRTRELDGLRYVCWPTSQNSEAFNVLIRTNAGREALGIFGALVQWAARAPVRGTLVDHKGPLTPARFAARFSVPEADAVAAFELLASPLIGWLESADAPPIDRRPSADVVPTARRSTAEGQEEDRKDRNGQEQEEDACAAPAADELRQWAADQAKRPEWLPTGKPWITAAVWLKLGQAVKSNGSVTFTDYAAIVREARESRHTLSNPAAFIVARLKALTKGTQ